MATPKTGIPWLILAAALAACGGEDPGQAQVRIKNDFNNPELAFQPPWTLCKVSYLGVDFGKLAPARRARSSRWSRVWTTC
jgi:hypothetical protein